MSTPHEPLPSGEAVEAAISAVLTAEREVDESIAACRRQAEARHERARHEVRLISERCEQRMRAIRKRYADALAKKLSEFRDQSDQLKDAYAPTAGELERLHRAVTALADESVGDTQ